MRRLSGRVTALEVTRAAGELSLTVRAWLGHPLNAAEEVQAAAEARQVSANPDWAKASEEMREWLQG